MGAFYADFVTSAGFAEEAAAIRIAWEAGNRREAENLVSDRLLETCTVEVSLPVPASGSLSIGERASGCLSSRFPTEAAWRRS
jgi:hypothetical protein